MAVSPDLYSGGTGVYTVSFKDENGSSVVPKSVTWSLFKERQYVNDRKDVSVTPASTVNIILSGDDLVSELQYLAIKAIYDSDLGNDLISKHCEQIFVIPCR